MKKMTSFRLTEETIKEIKSIAKIKGLSMSDVIAILVHCYDNDWFDADLIEDYMRAARTIG